MRAPRRLITGLWSQRALLDVPDPVRYEDQRVENYNGVNDYIGFGKRGELASNRFRGSD